MLLNCLSSPVQSFFADLDSANLLGPRKISSPFSCHPLDLGLFDAAQLFNSLGAVIRSCVLLLNSSLKALYICALHGTPGSACPQPEPNATELPSCAPSQCELHKDGGGGGVARRARATRALKAKSCATSCGTSSTTPRAASFTCSIFMCHLRTGVAGGLASGSPRAAAYLFCPLKGCVRRVLYVLALHVSTATATGPAAPTKGFVRSKSAWRDDEETVDEVTFWGRGGGGQLGACHGCEYLEKKVVVVVPLHPAALASVPYGIVLVRVRV